MSPSFNDSQSQLRIRRAPNFPFSSPILEEVPSPASSSEDRDMERNRPFEFLSKNTSRNPFIHESEYSTAASGGQMDGPNSNPTIRKGPEKPVGLNLVTDFSLPPPKNHNDAPAPAFVDLSDLKTLSKEREKEKSTQKIKNVLRRRPLQGFRRLPDEPSVAEQGHACLDPQERPSPSKKGPDELSPSDRPIVIGYTVPVDEVSGSQNDKPKELDSAESHTAPSIVITPAKEDSFWSESSPDYRRPRSSVYSQPTPQIAHNQSDVPPVPAIPALHSVAGNGNASSETHQRQSTFPTRNRALSTGTVFEEDASPQLGRRPRSYSEDTVNASQRQSVSSFVNKHQSQGWWTYLLSPLLSRSSTVASRKTPTSAERPPIPSVPTTAAEWWEEKEVSSFSPDTPETAVRGDDSSPGRDNGEGNRESPVEYSATSVTFPGRPVQGAAAEYYQACAHELFSGRPYFECVNHVCSITPKDQIYVLEDDSAAQPADGNRDPVLLDVDEPNESKNPFAKTSGPRDHFSGSAEPADGSRDPALLDVDEPNEPKNPFVEPSRPRDHFSGSTAVEDGANNPFDTDTGIKALKESAEESRATNDSPADKALSKAQQPTRLYPSEKQIGSREQSQPNEPPLASCIPFPSDTNPPQTTEPNEEAEPHRITVFPGSQAKVQSPDTPSPGLQRATEGGGSIPLSAVHGSPAPAYGSNDDSYPLPPRPDPYPFSEGEMVVPIGERYGNEAHRRRLEREDGIGERAGGLWRGRGPVSKKGCFGRPGREGRLRRRWYLAIATFFLIIVVLGVVLAITLTGNGHKTSVQSGWVNLTDYPPMPTGISTIAGPVPRKQVSGCIKPSTMWSCALPEEEQAANKPYPANQPNFRLSIRFRNETYDSENGTTPEPSPTTLRTRARNDLFEPSPSPPSIKDQIFLGKTTDENSKPYAGEETPFYITLLSPIKVSTHGLTRRSSFPNLTTLIPPPKEAPDGTAAAANLYPLPKSQPIRLYNRGEDDEHYGFYTYYDKSIFLESTAPLGGPVDKIPDNRNGGSTKEDARVRCTWAETRFLVQIWTRPTRSSKTLLDEDPAPSSTTTTTPTPSSSSSSSATDFTRPGSFPYPVTITIDRHGGTAKEKMVYCYGVDDTQHINRTEKKLQIEDMGFDGTLVQPAPGIFNNTDDDATPLIGRGESDIGPVDGGTGGCLCQWANWVSLV